MAYFIVIGTNNDVKVVVDEVKRAHLQHNVITSGCILSEDDGMYYHWDVFNEKGDKTNENREPIVLHDALTNQISQFKTLLPDDAIPNVFIVSKCFDEEESETLQLVCEELYNIGGAMLSGLQVDIVLVGYDLNKSENVTIRPHWRLLESLRGLAVGSRFHTNILYLNNMDYMGAATNVDSSVLSKFLCHWSKMVCAGGYDPKATIQSKVYSIGLSEYQYDFRDLNEFFKLSAEERLLNRKLNNSPSSDTQELLDSNYFKKIDLDIPWLDGFCSIRKEWEGYCTTPWDSAKSLSDNPYSVSRQELSIASYLNSYLKLYISEEQREIEFLQKEIALKEEEQSTLNDSLEELKRLTDEDDEKAQKIASISAQLSAIDAEITSLNNQIERHQSNIARNTFHDADLFSEKFGTMELITEEDEATYAASKAIVDNLVKYVKSEAGIAVMRSAIDNATVKDSLPDPYPAADITNIGRVKEVAIDLTKVPTLPSSQNIATESDDLSDKPGCLFWFKGLFGKKNVPTSESVESQTMSSRPAPISEEARKFLQDKLGKSVAAIRKADEVRAWWGKLCGIVDDSEKRKAECILLMDGEKNVTGGYESGKEGYLPRWHRKSVSLIDMSLVRKFRDENTYYKSIIDKFLNRWFDKGIELDKRMTMPELIKHQVLDALVGKYHTLHWDGTNPFVNEEISDERMHDIIETNLRQSKPFVEYVRIHESNIVSNLNMGFFSNNPNIPQESTSFRSKYKVSADSLNPVYLSDFVNSLCVIQIMDIPEHVDSLKDFKPRRDAELSRFRLDIKEETANIVGDALTVEEKARAIYNWICDNIAYDTTKQIHDAETCYRTKRGVCQAYSELFCYMAEAVGLTTDIIVGKTKSPKGKISTEKHSWVFVYTKAYDGILIDPTWGAGAIDGVTFVKHSDNSMWFDVSPYWMIFSHFPDQQYWTKLDLKVSEDQFKKIPYVNPTKETDGKNYLFESLSKL